MQEETVHGLWMSQEGVRVDYLYDYVYGLRSSTAGPHMLHPLVADQLTQNTIARKEHTYAQGWQQ